MGTSHLLANYPGGEEMTQELPLKFSFGIFTSRHDTEYIWLNGLERTSPLGLAKRALFNVPRYARGHQGAQVVSIVLDPNRQRIRRLERLCHIGLWRLADSPALSSLPRCCWLESRCSSCDSVYLPNLENYNENLHLFSLFNIPCSYLATYMQCLNEVARSVNAKLKASPVLHQWSYHHELTAWVPDAVGAAYRHMSNGS